MTDSAERLEREMAEFEATFPMPTQCIRCGDGYAATGYNAWAAHDYIQMWRGWQAARRAPAEEDPRLVALREAESQIEGARQRREERSARLGPFPAEAVAPSGWKLVPVEPTEEMHAAAVRTISRCRGNDDFPLRVYRAMLAAAPAAPKQED